MAHAIILRSKHSTKFYIYQLLPAVEADTASLIDIGFLEQSIAFTHGRVWRREPWQKYLFREGRSRFVGHA